MPLDSSTKSAAPFAPYLLRPLRTQGSNSPVSGQGFSTSHWLLADEGLMAAAPGPVDWSLAGGLDLTGHDALQIEVDAPAGTILLTIEDVLGGKWTRSVMTTHGGNRIVIPLQSFKVTMGGAGSPEGNSAPPSLERLRFQFTPQDGPKTPTALHWIGFDLVQSRGVAGPTMSLDPFFKYYDEHPWSDTAARLRGLGFTNALVVFTREIPAADHRAMIAALRAEGLAVTLRLNPPTDFEGWEAHPEWRQKMLNGQGRFDWRVYCCPNNPDFMDYYADRVAGLMRDYPYDALLLSEMWFEVWGGAYPFNPTRGHYACLCDHCVEKFRGRAAADARALFNDHSPLYFERKENAELYRQWVEFRCESVNAMGRRLAEAARAARPGITIGYMYLSDATVEPGRTREYQAQDLEGAIRATGARFVMIQDAWQDWTKARLRSEGFVRAYAGAYVQAVGAIDPAIPVLIHADVGSLPKMKRSARWMRQTAAHARQYGFSGVGYYEFTLNLDKYEP